MMGFFTNPKVAFGPGAIEQLGALSPRQVAVLVAPSVASLDPTRRLVEWLTEYRTKPLVIPTSGLVPTVAEVERLGLAVEGRPDLLVAVGGGGVLDVAKALRARLARPELPLAKWSPLTEVASDQLPRLAAIPTTGGSGSEMSGTAHLLDADGETREVAHRALTPDWALLDPDFARTLPAPEALACGMEGVAHALEALASEWANPFTDAFARDAIALGLPALVKLARQPRDSEARAALFYAASRAGLAAANSSLGLAHAWARALLPELPSLGYARLLTASLPTVVEYNFPSKRDVYEGVLPLFATGSEAIGESFGARLAAIARQVGLPADLRGAGVDVEAVRSARERIGRRVLTSTATVANPRVPSAGEAGRLLESILNGVGRRPP